MDLPQSLLIMVERFLLKVVWMFPGKKESYSMRIIKEKSMYKPEEKLKDQNTLRELQ